jgi:hypothetical protein
VLVELLQRATTMPGHQAAESMRLPIDTFFSSLAREWGDLASSPSTAEAALKLRQSGRGASD